MLSSDLSSSVA